MTTSKRYLAGIGLVALLGLAAFAITIWRLDPFTSTALALPFLFASLFLALTGILALVGFYSRVWFGHGEIYTAHIGISLRQGALVALAVCGALLFQILRILTWWDGLLIIAAFFLVEIYFSAKD